MSPQTMFKIITCLLLTALTPTAHGAEQGKTYIYDAKEAGDNRALVIDAVAHNAKIQDKRSVHDEASSGDLGGNYDDCSDETYFCLTGMLEIIIPRSMPKQHWQHHDVSCRATALPGSDAFRITCRSPKYRGHPSLSYSLSRGVLSIDSSPIGGERGGFVLRGQLGLLAPGKHP